jgi:protein involved in polysaccharide export with SLBB domain
MLRHRERRSDTASAKKRGVPAGCGGDRRPAASLRDHAPGPVGERGPNLFPAPAPGIAGPSKRLDSGDFSSHRGCRVFFRTLLDPADRGRGVLPTRSPRRPSRPAALLLCASLAACASPPATCDPVASGAAEAPEYRLGAGDRIRVTVFRQPNLSGQLQLDGQGYLAMPLVGEVAANRLTPRDLEDAIEARFREEDYLIDPHVSIEVLTYRPFYILGEVRRPGQYPYENGMTMINAIALAGGYTDRAQTATVIVKRADCTFIAQADTIILPDEIITVPERFF